MPMIVMALLFLAMSTPSVAEWVNRPDAMHWHRLADFDRLEDRVRLLYYSQPSLEQSTRPGWTINVYIAELYPDGRIDNRQLTTGQRNFAALLLQRGGDGVFALVVPERAESGHTLEFWSAEDGTVRASSSPAALESSIKDMFPTDDGNFFMVSQSAQSARGDQANTLTFTKLSPDGAVLATGTWSNPTAMSSLAGAFPVPGGGMGVSLTMRVIRGAEALDTDVEAIQQFAIGGRTIEARVFAETRLLATDASGDQLWTSPALERDLSWQGDMAIPKDLPADQIMAQNSEQMALMGRVTLNNGGDRRLMHLSTVEFDDIQKSPGGYGMLARVTADRSLEPPQHGAWYLEVGDDGRLKRELRIEPAAERLKAKFETFLPAADGGLFVAGVRRAASAAMHVSALDRKGAVEWTARLDMKPAKIEGIAGPGTRLWVFGHGFNDAGNKNLLWAELVNPDKAEQISGAAASATAVGAKTRPGSASKATSPIKPELPEAAEGCSCSCEEFAKIQTLTDLMRTASKAEMFEIVSDPAIQALMECTSGCGLQYAKCR